MENLSVFSDYADVGVAAAFPPAGSGLTAVDDVSWFAFAKWNLCPAMAFENVDHAADSGAVGVTITCGFEDLRNRCGTSQSTTLNLIGEIGTCPKASVDAVFRNVQNACFTFGSIAWF